MFNSTGSPSITARLAPRKKLPVAPSSKNPFGTGGLTAGARAIVRTSSSKPVQGTATPTPRTQQQQWSAWAAKPSERRQPPVEPMGAPKSKLPSTKNAAAKTDDAESSRWKCVASGDGGSGGGGDGGGGSRVEGCDDDAPGKGSSSPSKHPPPR